MKIWRKKTVWHWRKTRKWLQAFLENRKQQILIKERKSEKIHVESWSIQGRVLGPVFPPIFILDIFKNVRANIKLFVDDAKIKEVIENEEDVEKLQMNLDQFYLWNSMAQNFKYWDMAVRKTLKITQFISHQTWRK